MSRIVAESFHLDRVKRPKGYKLTADQEAGLLAKRDAYKATLVAGFVAPAGFNRRKVKIEGEDAMLKLRKCRNRNDPAPAPAPMPAPTAPLAAAVGNAAQPIAPAAKTD